VENAHKIRLTGANFTFLMLQDELSLLFEQLALHNPQLLGALRSGLNARELRGWERDHEACLPQEVFDLYCICDGTTLVGLESEEELLPLGSWLDNLNLDCLRFTNTTFFVPFEEAQKQLHGSFFYCDAYEQASIVAADEIVCFVKPFAIFDYQIDSDYQKNLPLVPCTRIRYPSLPLYDSPSHDLPYFWSSSIEALIRTQRRLYEEGLMRFDAHGKRRRAWMHGDYEWGRIEAKSEEEIRLECDPLALELTERLYRD